MRFLRCDMLPVLPCVCLSVSITIVYCIIKMVNILSNLIFFTWLTHDSSFSLTKLWQKSYIVLPASRDHRWSISTNEKCTIFTYMLLWQKQYKIDTVKYILVIKNHM